MRWILFATAEEGMMPTFSITLPEQFTRLLATLSFYQVDIPLGEATCDSHCGPATPTGPHQLPTRRCTVLRLLLVQCLLSLRQIASSRLTII